MTIIMYMSCHLQLIFMYCAGKRCTFCVYKILYEKFRSFRTRFCTTKSQNQNVHDTYDKQSTKHENDLITFTKSAECTGQSLDKHQPKCEQNPPLLDFYN